tara:strand:- start:11305 stop:11904 length:600 start_codon:yes stop_codon:yes gene_type:complete
MASDVDIANTALTSLGATTITSLDENSNAARVINQRFNNVRDDVFRSHPWNCLISRVDLGQETTTPAFGYAHQYALPADFLRVLEFTNGTLTYPQDNMISNSGGAVYVIEGKKLLTDEDTAKIKYIARVTDPNQLDANVIEALAARLAMECCYKITGSTSMIQQMRSLYEDKIKQARFTDATEGAPMKVEASDFIESRF